MKIRHIATACALTLTGASALADSSVTLYGDIDLYGNYMKSSSGVHILSLEDGAYLRSRWGFRGNEDLGGGYAATFRLEGGFSGDTGGSATSGILFDRQSYVGLDTPFGEFRGGRQNGPIQARGGYIDYTARTLGSVINNFGVPSRYDNDVSYISKRMSGVQVEAHVSLPEAAVGNHAIVYQGSIDYVDTNYVVGYMGIRGRPPTNAVINKDMAYDNVYADWNYGQGTIYLAWVRSNNITSSATVSKTGGTIVGNTGGYNAGTNTDLNHFYDIWQVSADYKVLPNFRVGALYGKIDDKSGRKQGGTGGSVGGYYDLSKRTMIYSLVETMSNETNGGWRPSGSAGLKTNFTLNDVNGRRISGVQLGVLHKF